ncbi:MAG TPA: hypothetical protein VHG92_15025 [Afifellaceae bacterium]|nr:hypothetical protein [Afifellaceae bacterium]
MSDEAAVLEAEEEQAETAAPDLPLLSMLFTASSWTANSRFNRSGRMESEAVYAVGELAFRSEAGERRTFPGRALIVSKDPKLRLDLVLSPNEAVITVPLEEFSLGRLRDQIKELVSGYGLVMRIGFRAADRPGRQMLASVDFAFSSVPRAPQGPGRNAA